MHAHKLAFNVYKYLKNNIPELPNNFSFQIIEQENENDSLVFICEPSNAFPKYYLDVAERVRFKIVLIQHKLAHRTQLHLINSIIQNLADYWESEDFKILQKQINQIPIFKNVKHTNWVQLDPVRFSIDNQEYAVNLDLMFIPTGGQNV